MDGKINKEDRWLVGKLEEVGWYIFNGCGKGDRKSAWTYSGGRGHSVLDYVIEDREVWEEVERLKVEERVDLDHFPVTVWIKGSDGRTRKRKGRELGRNGRKKVRGLFKEKVECF
ncbi:hypothetical protein P5V15_001349 [Pogonomyrmex californicus]